MKLTVPAVRPTAPDPHRQEVSDLTVRLLAEIDALLAASGWPAATAPASASTGVAGHLAQPLDRPQVGEH
jgi:hypothetical protein